ncbi:hypothetical protein I6J71_19295 [Amycolatopsis sp. FDAARGOS 1241]|nr:hypothetical protein I6J71_19295 [Amycolatopsis sp. FDAARGOS 1241]
MLVERYLLPDTDVAHAVLRGASQTSNVRMADLARTLLDLPRPGSTGPWLTGDLRPAAPPVAFPCATGGFPCPAAFSTTRCSPAWSWPKPTRVPRSPYAHRAAAGRPSRPSSRTS